jgi:uncharacterized protein YidB (DUF937 family)
MGLLDILNGMQNGPRGQAAPPTGRASGGGMSPMMMALLALLAYKGLSGGGRSQTAPTGSTNAGTGGGGLGDILGSIFGGGGAGASRAPSGGGGLGDILGGMLGGGGRPAAPGGGLGDILGGLLGGGNAGNVLNGGLGNILKEFERSGQAKAAQSWVGTGPNQSVSPGDLESALGADTLDQIAQRSGLDRSELAAGFSEHLPELVDQLTPNGRLPTREEASRWV